MLIAAFLVVLALTALSGLLALVSRAEDSLERALLNDSSSAATAGIATTEV
ncbi:MAG: hypothetical protein ACTHNT_13730 [Actinomycetales bacterium]